MSEFDLRNNYFHNSGFPIKIDYSLIQLDLYRLLCHFAASPIIDDISKKYSNILINDYLRIEYEKSEISRILLNLAIIARNELDNNNQFLSGQSDDNLDVVGKLYNSNNAKETDLTFREACNKIIHCEYINWDMKNPKSINKYDGLNPIIYLYGSYYEKKWKAKIVIYDFTNVYIRLIQI